MTKHGKTTAVILLAASASIVGGALAAGRKGDAKAPSFEDVAREALDAMEKRAGELHVTGAAVVAHAEGETIKGWSSRMRVVGTFQKPGNGNDPGSNLLAIAYAKACEMAASLADSGNAGRPPLKGETGWRGGVTRPAKTGRVFAAFSGGPSDDDVKVSQAGLEVLGARL